MTNIQSNSAGSLIAFSSGSLMSSNSAGDCCCDDCCQTCPDWYQSCTICFLSEPGFFNECELGGPVGYNFPINFNNFGGPFPPVGSGALVTDQQSSGASVVCFDNADGCRVVAFDARFSVEYDNAVEIGWLLRVVLDACAVPDQCAFSFEWMIDFIEDLNTGNNVQNFGNLSVGDPSGFQSTFTLVCPDPPCNVQPMP